MGEGLNAKLQANQSLSTQESRLAVIKRRAYAVACAVGLLGIAVGFLGISDAFRFALYGFLFVFTGITLSMVLNPKISIQRIERFGFSYSIVFVVLRAAYSILSAHNSTTLGAALTEAYSSMAFVALLGYILLETRFALRVSIAVVGIIFVLGSIKIVPLSALQSFKDLIVVMVKAFTNAVAQVTFAYVLALSKDLLAAEQIRSSTDPLTGAANRWQMYNALETIWQNSKTKKQIFSIILLDIDHFKRINDTHGHNVGDNVLQEVTRVLKKYIGNFGTVGRWGGEEFLVLLPHATLEQARVHAENLRNLLAKHDFKISKVTASFGAASLLPNESIPELTRRADEALYNAKHSGRNRVEIKPRVSQEIEPLEISFQDPRATSHS